MIINDHVDIACKLDAAGVHIGQSDMPLSKARAMLGENKIIGVSARTVDAAIQAKTDGADYLGVGAVFQTTTKADAQTLDHRILREICKSVSIPIVAIGGITQNNIHLLNGSGISGAAVISALFNESDITAAAKILRKKIEQVTA